MKAYQVGKLLDNAMRISEHFGGGGWRQYLPAATAARYDQTKQSREAIGQALSPGGWAHEMRGDAERQQVCMVWGESDGKRYCARARYMGLSAAAIAYMVIDLRGEDYKLQTAEFAAEQERKRAAAPAKKPRGRAAA